MCAQAQPLYSGLFVQGNPQQAVPLSGVSVHGEISGPCALVTVTQRYVNAEEMPVEAVYVFPLPEGAAVCGFEAVIGDRIVSGRVEERERAYEIYDDAKNAGHGAFLLEQERPNVFTVSLGNLRPRETVDVRIRYVELLPKEGAAWRWTVPTTVSPRYVPFSGSVGMVGQPDGERVNPPHAFNVPYGLTLDAEISAAVPMRSVECLSHPVRVIQGKTAMRVELSTQNARMDRDFVLVMDPQEDLGDTFAVTAKDDGNSYVQLTFTPKLAAGTEPGFEVLFLVDCSGSMGGDSIEQARQTLQLCLRALTSRDTFDIAAFGSRHRFLWGSAQPFDAAAMQRADAFIRHMNADMGGTEIMTPLQELLLRPADPERPRRIVLLTDGQVSNERAIIDLCQANRDMGRVFSFGIGAGASEYLVRGVARASGGLCEMVFPGEHIGPKVLRMFGRVRGVVAEKLQVDWGVPVEPAPADAGPLYDQAEVTLFARAGKKKPSRVRLEAGAWSQEAGIQFRRPQKDGPIPILWARHRIRDLEMQLPQGNGLAGQLPPAQQALYDELVALGKRYGLVSSATSYVAVEERTEGFFGHPAPLRRVPVQLTAGWGGTASVAGTGNFGSAPGAVKTLSAISREPVRKTLVTPGASSWPESRSSRGTLTMGCLTAGGFRKEQFVDAGSADPLYDLLLTQNADGSFPFSDALRNWLGQERWARVRAAAERFGQEIVTAVVVALLELEARERREEWQPAVRKANSWLMQRGFDGSTAVRALL